ncbi:MAG: membrane protein insertion efficiency factor YidD [Clostridia bacterium]
MTKFKKIIFFPFELIGIGLIWFYKFLISPILPSSCCFVPTCSSYALKAIEEFGIFYGLILTFKRLVRCNPRSRGGFDPVPLNIKGDKKWLF